jgi:hypothetical protein
VEEAGAAGAELGAGVFAGADSLLVEPEEPSPELEGDDPPSLFVSPELAFFELL